jgi:hypothetical protein
MSSSSIIHSFSTSNSSSESSLLLEPVETVSIGVRGTFSPTFSVTEEVKVSKELFAHKKEILFVLKTFATKTQKSSSDTTQRKLQDIAKIIFENMSLTFKDSLSWVDSLLLWVTKKWFPSSFSQTLGLIVQEHLSEGLSIFRSSYTGNSLLQAGEDL